MTEPALPRLRFFETSPATRHIKTEDRHLLEPPTPRYRLGIVGTGTMGQEHMRVALLAGRCAVHGVFDSQPLSVNTALANLSLGHGVARYESIESMASDPEIDAFVVCTPNHSHLEVCRALTAAGKPILLEKPMATRLEDGRALAELARQHPAFIQIGLQYRYKAPYREAWHELKSRGSLGNLKTLSMSEYRPPFLDKVGQWNKLSRLSGGTLVEKCCHYFDLMQQFSGGRPTRVMASGGRAVNFIDYVHAGEPADMDDHAFVLIDYANGVRGSFTLNMFSPGFHEELVLVGDRGRLVTSEQFDPQRPGDARSTVTIETPEPGARRKTDIAYGDVIETSGHFGATYHEHLAFIDQLDGKSTSAASVTDGLWSMVVAVAAQSAIVSGQSVAIDPLLEQYGLDDILA